MGSVTVDDNADGSLTLTYDLELSEASAAGGVHIHVGTGCSEPTGAHYYDDEAGAGGSASGAGDLRDGSGTQASEDPWSTTWASDSSGAAQGTVTVASGINHDGNLGHAVVVHAANGDRIACAILRGAVQRGWDNHFAAFGAQDTGKILKDYTEQSQVLVYDAATNVSTNYTGVEAVEALFTGLFALMSDTSTLAVRKLLVEESKLDSLGQAVGRDPYPQVLLVWECPSSNLFKVTDTFLFDSEGTIVRQNIVVWTVDGLDTGAPDDASRVAATGGPTQAGWDNHFAAFLGQDVARILQDYTEDSEINVFDITTGDDVQYSGLTGVRNCFEGLFAALDNMDGAQTPLIHIEEGPLPMVLLVWEAPNSGYLKVTDTFIFDGAGKIMKQNVVVQSGPRPTARPTIAATTIAATTTTATDATTNGAVTVTTAAAAAGALSRFGAPAADTTGRPGAKRAFVGETYGPAEVGSAAACAGKCLPKVAAAECVGFAFDTRALDPAFDTSDPGYVVMNSRWAVH